MLFRSVVLRRRKFVVRGEVSNWLVSDAFDLKQARSGEAESAIERALAVLRDPAPTLRAIEEVHQALLDARLPDLDPFWVRWGHYKELHLAKARPGDAKPNKGKQR